MKSLLNPRDRNEVLDRLARISTGAQPRWGTMSAHQMICHLSDSFRVSLGEKQVKPSGTFFTRTIMKWFALWVPIHWPRDIQSPPELDQRKGGTPPAEFSADVGKLRILLERFCAAEGKFGAHAFFGQMSRAERMRHAYLHMDHHLRQFGA